MEENNDILTLVDEESVEHQFEVEAIMEVDEAKYAVLVPLDEKYLYADEAVVMRFGTDESGEEILFDVENDEEWEKVADAYVALVESADSEDMEEAVKN